MSSSQPELLATSAAPGSSSAPHNSPHNSRSQSTTSQVSSKKQISPKRARAAATRLAHNSLDVFQEFYVTAIPNNNDNHVFLMKLKPKPKPKLDGHVS